MEPKTMTLRPGQRLNEEGGAKNAPVENNKNN